MQAGQLNPLFQTFADLINKIGVQQITDWLVLIPSFLQLSCVSSVIESYDKHRVIYPSFRHPSLV